MGYKSIREHMEDEKADMLQSTQSDYVKMCMSVVSAFGVSMDDTRYELFRKIILNTDPEERANTLAKSLYYAMDPSAFSSRLILYRPDRLERRKTDIREVLSEYKSIASEMSKEFGLKVNMSELYARLEILAEACDVMVDEHVKSRSGSTPGVN